jgi:hypothetical protein
MAIAVLQPSITYWVRGEPDARSDATDALVVPLQARVRDPLWFLTRQWQLGEFQGANGGSPAFVAVSELRGQMTGWSVQGQSTTTPIGNTPLEYQCAREPFTPDLATRVELGQTFERLLAEHSQPTTIAALFRTAYAIDPNPTDPSDLAEVRLRSVVAGRAIDGLALAAAAQASAPNLPAPPAVPGPNQGPVLEALTDYLAWITATFDAWGTTDPTAWAPTKLAYALDVEATAPTSAEVTFVAAPGSDGMLDWVAFDLESPTVAGVPTRPAGPGANNQGPVPTTRAVIPAHVRFRGMPNARFWDFELAGADLGSIIPDRRDLARLALIDFALVHSTDWFIIPIDLAPGSLYQVASMVVHDVFGVTTPVERADRQPNTTGQWSMFTTSILGQPATTTADFFTYPASAASGLQTGTVIEQAKFGRDEMANMVWGIEQITENALGAPWSGHERDIARNVPAPGVGTPPPPLPPGIALRYNIQTRVPEYWIPFIPMSIDPALDTVALERASMLRDDGTPILPAGRILNPSALTGNPYRIDEAEVARTGVRIQRVVCRSRWTDGSTALWTMRRRGPGGGETSSGLKFDEAADS